MLSNASSAIIALGDGKTLEDAFNNAITNKFVEGDDIKEANRILINISYSKVSEIAVGDIQFAQDYVKKEFRHYKSLKVGNIENNDLDTKIRVAIIASFKKEEKQKINNDLFEEAEYQKQEEEKVVAKEDSNDVFGRPAYEIHKPRKL